MTTHPHARTASPPLSRPNRRLGRSSCGAALLTTAASALAVILEVLLVAAGFDLAVTGSLGHCPHYARLGRVPQSLRRPT